MKTNHLLLCACLCLFVLSCKKEFAEQQAPAATPGGDRIANIESDNNYEWKANEILVKFKTGLSQSARNQIMSLVSADVARHLLSQAMISAGDNEGVYVLHIPGKVPDAIARLKDIKDLVYAEPNFRYQHDKVSNDPYFTNNNLWGMYGDASSPANQFGSQAAEAWGRNHVGNANVVVGIIDEGAMFNHTDLKANFRVNTFDPVDGVDNDGNGYIDDFHGWDFFEDNNGTFDGTTDDHGTHVAGTIGAKGGNGTGVAGVNWNITLYSGKFLGPQGGFTDDAVLACDYFTDLKTRHNLRLVATNNSWGGGGYSQALKDAIDRAGNANILFVAAAGNNTTNNDATPHYPSSYTSSNIIAVAAITKTGGLSSFSNWGANSVDIGAPGSGIYSTLPGNNNTSLYGAYDGTSMATPHVTGAVALYASTHANASAASIKSAILNKGIPTSSLTGKCTTGARLNMSSF